jgi:hypothetical protein
VTVNVKDFGCVGDGVAVDTANFQRAINSVAGALHGGGRIFVPSGRYNLTGGIVVPDNVWVEGEQRNCAILQSLLVDSVVVTAVGLNPTLTSLTIVGAGATNDASGATKNALVVTSIEGIFRDLVVAGGASAIYTSGVDNLFENVKAEQSTGRALVTSVGADWYVRCKFDGSSGWRQQAAGISFLNGVGENHLTQVDLSGYFVNSIEFDASSPSVGSAIVVVSDSVLSSGVTLVRGDWFCLNHCEIGGGDIAINPSYIGTYTVDSCYAIDQIRILVGSTSARGVISNNEPASMIQVIGRIVA